MSRALVCTILVISAVILLGASHAQNPGVHFSSAAPGLSRYEIVQSALTIRDTYRIDRLFGRVHRMVASANGDVVWEEMPVHERLDVEDGKFPRFQLFVSGIAARSTFLIDTQTGATWQVREVADPNTPETKTTEWFPINVYNLKK